VPLPEVLPHPDTASAVARIGSTTTVLIESVFVNLTSSSCP